MRLSIVNFLLDCINQKAIHIIVTILIILYYICNNGQLLQQQSKFAITIKNDSLIKLIICTHLTKKNILVQQVW